MSKKDILKACRMQCSACFGETNVRWPIANPQDVKECTAEKTCYLYPYRLGKDPNVSHKRSENAKRRNFGKIL